MIPGNPETSEDDMESLRSIPGISTQQPDMIQIRGNLRDISAQIDSMQIREAIGAICPEVLERLNRLPGTSTPIPPEDVTVEGHHVLIHIPGAAHIMEEVCEHNPPGGKEPDVIDVSESEKEDEA
ncbi:hypothetical protein R1sor_027327 [Riccia sorocarpa]|uniref:Uncharacterized protein n=1 Tax=Riccia sorocarpa TaxID=122646 RepID=A0ABD3GI46_9MARC